MMLLQRNKLCHMLPYYTASRTIPVCYHNLINFSFVASFTTKTPPSPNSNFIVGYLIDSCRLSSHKAEKASKYLTHVKSTFNPDSILRFLRQSGFDDTHIKKVVSWEPKILCASVEKTLEPKLRMLQELQFSQSQIIQLVSANATLLRCCNLQRKIEFWISVFGNSEKLVKALQRDKFLLTYSLDKTIMRNLSLLHDCGVSDSQVGKLVLCTPRFIGRNIDSLKVIIQRVYELGVSHGSAVFWQALHTIFCHSKTTINAKLRLFKELGWSESELATMITKCPCILDCSEKNIRDTAVFLMKEVGCELSYVATRPTLLKHSLERRLIPRYRVKQILKAKKLPEGGHDFYSIILYVEKKFLCKYVLPYKGKIPELEQAYPAASSKIPA